jgi:hypothetical protein
VIHNPCPANGNTKRDEVKGLIDAMEQLIPSARENLLTALSNVDLSGLWLEKGEK